jgi:hypothetical protein
MNIPLMYFIYFKMLSYDSLTIISSFVEGVCLNDMSHVSKEWGMAVDEEIQTNGCLRKTLRWREVIYDTYKNFINVPKTKSIFATSCSLIREMNPVISNLDEYLKYCDLIPYKDHQNFILKLFQTCCYLKFNNPTPSNPRSASNTITMMVMIRLWKSKSD